MTVQSQSIMFASAEPAFMWFVVPRTFVLESHMPAVSRRSFLQTVATTIPVAAGVPTIAALADEFSLKYIVGSCMYGYMYIGEILPEVAKCGAKHLDLWPKRHGNQREQLQDMGEELFTSLLKNHQVEIGCITQYPLGPFGLQEEMKLAKRLGCPLIVTGGEGPKGLTGMELKKAVVQFVEKMKPHLVVAEENGVTVAIENHPGNLFQSADSLRYLRELTPSKSLGIALAPHHLPQDPEQLAALIRELDGSLAMFYAWEHGDGCMAKLPKEQELLQLPGRGPLDFRPLLRALADIKYQGWTEIFMHPFPRGIPILETAAEVTAEINRSREYLAKCL
jgi:sugar phosphate isomerase/epimerase